MRKLSICISVLFSLHINAIAQECTVQIDTGYITERQYWAHYPIRAPISTEPQMFIQRDKATGVMENGQMAKVWVGKQYGRLYLFGNQMHDESINWCIPPCSFGKVTIIFSNGDCYQYDAPPKHGGVSFAALLQGKEKLQLYKDNHKLLGYPKVIRGDTNLLGKLLAYPIQEIHYSQGDVVNSGGKWERQNIRPVIIYFDKNESLKLQQALRCLAR